MKLELLMKELDKSSFVKTPEQKEEDALKKLLSTNPDEEDDMDLKFTYNPYIIDFRDINTFGKDDNEHTKIATPFALYIAQVDYELFKNIYEEWSGVKIKRLSDYRIRRK